MKINKAIALRVANLMDKNNKMTQYELSVKSTVEESTISRILSEETKFIQIQTIFKLASAFDLSITEFFDDKLFRKNAIDIF